MSRKATLVAVSVAVLLWGGWYYSSRTAASKVSVRLTEKDTVAVSTGTVRSVIQGVGTASASSTQALQFNSNGKIVKWNAAPGNAVKKGQILAEVDSRDVDNDIRSQELALKNAQLAYEKLFTAAKDYQIANMEAQISSAERNIAANPEERRNLEMERDAKLSDQKSAIAQTERSLSIAREKLVTLESDIAYVKASSENTVEKSGTDVAYVLSTSSTDASTQLSDARAFVQDLESSALNLDEPNATPSSFAAKDASKGVKAVNDFSYFRGLSAPYSEKLAAADFSNTGGVSAFLSERESFANAGVAAADSMTRALEATLAAGTLSQSVLDSLSSTVASYRSKFVSSVNGVASVRKQIASIDDPALVRQNADNTVANKKSAMLDQQSSVASLTANLASQKAALTKLESDYAIKLQSKTDALSGLEEGLKVSRLNLEDLKNGPTSEEKRSALNQIEQAKISLDKARKRKEDYQIIAGFDGIVTASNGKVGEISTNSNSSNTAATSVTVEIPGLYEISVLVDQLDVVKIKTGLDTEVRFDAYPEKSFTGKVSEVDPTPVTNQGVVSYKAKIFFQSGEWLRLYNSMTATVAIVTEKRENVLMVPTLAISPGSDAKKSVRVWKNGRPVSTEVTVGLSEGANSEIRSGLTLEDRVVSTAFSLSKSPAAGGFSLFGIGNRSRTTGSGSSGAAGGAASPRPSGAPSQN